MRPINVQDWLEMMKVIIRLTKAIETNSEAINRSTHFK